MKQVNTACPLDCWDSCAIHVTVDGTKVINAKGDKNHPITQGFLCEKGLKHLNRLHSPDRITSPMKKIKEQWVAISWEEAIHEIGDHLLRIKENYGSTSLLHYSESGHCGLLKSIDSAFFKSYGGVTTPEGSLCWGAGIAAQTLDFGKVLSHDPEDHLHAKTIVIWGRNPAYTNVHLMPFLKRAKEMGKNIVVIDPIKTATAAFATHYYQVKPESDGYLALALIRILLDENRADTEFVSTHCKDFEAFSHYVRSLHLDELIANTGLTKEAVHSLSALYGHENPSAIILGYGLQRYHNGGKNIRFIDALAAITGNIGITGGGVSYANKYVTQWIDWDYAKNTLSYPVPTFKRALFGQYILEEAREQIQGIFVLKGNPVLQLPNTENTLTAFQSIPFKVVIDHFMTDTAQLADYVLPCTHVYEEEDFFSSSMWHSYFHYTERVLEPREGVKSEFEIFQLLAKYMGLNDFLTKYPDEKSYLKKSLAPLLQELNLSLEEIQGKRIKLEGNTVPWQNKIFSTPSKKFEFFVPSSLGDIFIKEDDVEYPLQFLTLHPKHSLHSQHYLEEAHGQLPEVYCNEETLVQWQVQHGERVVFRSKYGSIQGTILADDRIGPNLLMAYEGWWLKNQGINRLTPPGISDIGDQAVYNNCLCRIEKLPQS